LNPLLHGEGTIEEVFMFKFIIPIMLCTTTALAQTPCRDLKTVSLPDTTITSAELIPAGPYKSPANAPAFPPPPSVDLPGYCMIAAVLYHGWSDFGIAPGNTINYYSSVLSAMGSGQDDWLRLFMVPAMGHCRGGDAPDQADYMSAMERWREAGISPDRITAYHVTDNRVDITRPLCPYPQVAVYTGTGSTNNSENFFCRAPDSAK
jgi:hypothetical protein